MAIRHEVACRSGNRLSLSLQCSDHKKAQMIARQLNTRLAELKLNPDDVMAEREQLQKLFEHIRDEMLAKLDDISTMAKRKWSRERCRRNGTRPRGWLGLPAIGQIRHEQGSYCRRGLQRPDLSDPKRSARLPCRCHRGKLSRRTEGGAHPCRRGWYPAADVLFDVPDTALNREKGDVENVEGRPRHFFHRDHLHVSRML